MLRGLIHELWPWKVVRSESSLWSPLERWKLETGFGNRTARHRMKQENAVRRIKENVQAFERGRQNCFRVLGGRCHGIFSSVRERRAIRRHWNPSRSQQKTSNASAIRHAASPSLLRHFATSSIQSIARKGTKCLRVTSSSRRRPPQTTVWKAVGLVTRQCPCRRGTGRLRCGVLLELLPRAGVLAKPVPKEVLFGARSHGGAITATSGPSVERRVDGTVARCWRSH